MTHRRTPCALWLAQINSPVNHRRTALRRVSEPCHRTAMIHFSSPLLTGIAATALNTYSLRRLLPYLRPPHVAVKIPSHRRSCL